MANFLNTNFNKMLKTTDSTIVSAAIDINSNSDTYHQFQQNEYLKHRLQYHAASRVGISVNQSLAQATNIDGHTVVDSQVWTAKNSEFPKNRGSQKTTSDVVGATNDLVQVFMSGATAVQGLPSNLNGKVFENSLYPAVQLVKQVEMTQVENSDAQSWEILNETTRLMDWVAPTSVKDDGRPVPGFTGIIEASDDGTTWTILQKSENLKYGWKLEKGNWQFVYMPGMLTFHPDYIPSKMGYSKIRITGFIYNGEKLSDNLTAKDAAISAAFGSESEVLISKENGITKSGVTIGGATLDTTALSTKLATEAAVRNAIDTKAISISGIDAINVTGTTTEKSIYLTIDPDDKVLEQSETGLKASFTLSGQSQPVSSTYSKKYFLLDKNGNTIGDTIDIQKDKSLSGVVYDDKKKELTFVYYKADGSTVSATIQLSGLVDVYDSASGITSITTTSGITFIGNIDTTTEKHNDVAFLTVGADGFKVDGIQTAINDTIEPVSTFLSSVLTGFTNLSGETVKDVITTLSTELDLTSTYLSTNITSINNRLSGIPSGVRSVLTTIEAASAYASDNAYGRATAQYENRVTTLETQLENIPASAHSVKDYIDAEISTLEGKAVTSAATAESNAKSYTDDQISKLESKAAASAVAASANAYSLASADLETFKTGDFSTLSSKVDENTSALNGYTSANAVSNKFTAVDTAIEEAKKGSSDALTSFIENTYKPEQAAQNTRLTNLEEYVSGSTNGLKKQIDDNAAAAATSAAGISAIIGSSDAASAVDGSVFARITYNKGNIATVSADLATEVTNRETAVSNARTDLSAYVDAASSNLNTAITTEVTNRETAVSNARTDLSAYVDAVSGVLGADIHTVSADLASEITNRETAVSTARTDLSAYVDAASGNLKNYTDTKVSSLGQVFKFKGYTPDKTSATLPTATSATIGDVYLVDEKIETSPEVIETAQYVGVSGLVDTTIKYSWQKLGIKTSIGAYATKAYVDAQDKILSTAITTETTDRTNAVSSARTDLSAYVDAVSGILGADLHTVSADLADEVTDRTNAVSSARTDLSAYVNATSSVLGGDIHTVSADLASEVTNRTNAVSSARTDLSAYVDTASGNVLNFVASTYVTIAEHEALSGEFQELHDRMDEFWKSLSGQIK